MLRLHRDAAAIILPVLARMCPSIAHLNLCQSIESDTAVSASSAAICGFSNLTTLVINTPLSTEAFVHLGRMKSLKALETRYDPRVDTNDMDDRPYFDTVLRPPVSPFSTLRSLMLAGSSLQLCDALLKSMQCHRLESLSLVIATSTIDQFHQIFDRLTPENYPLIRGVIIRNPLPVHTIQLSKALPVIARCIDGVMMKPLLAQSNLTVVDINPLHTTFNLTDEVLLLMATSWPWLQTLYLGHIFGWRRMSDVTLDGLVPLVTYCPDLQNLGIVLDAAIAPTRTDEDRPINDKITTLHLGDSTTPMEFPHDIAEFLSDLFPKLTRIRVSNEAVSLAWNTVESMILQLGEFGEIAEVEDW